MIVKQEFEISFRDVGKSNKITNSALLNMLENIAGMHSNQVGYGLNNIAQTGVTWVLLNWKLRVFSRPTYGETLEIETWARKAVKFYTYRDFRVYDKNHNLVAIATSKWAFLDATTMSIARITPELLALYAPEDIAVFEDEAEPNKLPIPEKEISQYHYQVARRDIDINQHMHNLYYLDLAYETLPNDIYTNNEFNQVEIMYKKEIKLGESIKCLYSCTEQKHLIAIKSLDDNTLHAIIQLS